MTIIGVVMTKVVGNLALANEFSKIKDAKRDESIIYIRS